MKDTDKHMDAHIMRNQLDEKIVNKTIMNIIL